MAMDGGFSLSAGADMPRAAEGAEGRNQHIDLLASSLEKRAVDLARKREPLSRRWYADIQQYEGRYPDDVRSALERDPTASKLFVNMTRPKTRIMKSRLTDVLFPTDDLNWDIEPTPDPELAEPMEVGRTPDASGSTSVPVTEPAAGPPAAPPQDPAAGGPMPGGMPTGEPAGPMPPPPDPKAEERKEARKRAGAMKRVMEDQLVECGYAGVGQQVIDQACIFGTGVLKGPMHRTDRRKWNREARAFEYVEELVPVFEWVDLWNFFPDMEATEVSRCAEVFELHRLSERELRELARRSDFFKDEIRELLKEKPKYESFLDYVRDVLDDRGEIVNESNESRYYAWEYHGTVTREQMGILADRHAMTDIQEGYGEGDPLDTIDVIVWVCHGRILKFGPHPLDSGEILYSVFRFDGETGSLFRDGIPAMLRDQQIAINSAWRLMMQNGALRGLPMFVFDRNIKPVDGRRTIAPGKVFERETPNEAAGIFPIAIPSDSKELVQIIELARMFMDDETNLPLVAQGQQGQATKTAHGLSLLANAVNIIFRDAARAFDRDLTEPTLRRLYEWNMQYGTDDSILGDMKVKPRGSSVLLVRDIQGQNLLMVLNLAATNPAIGQMLKMPEIARRLFQALQLSKDEMVLTNDEMAQLAKELADKGDPQQEAEIMKAEVQLQVEEMKLRIEVAKIASQENIAYEKILADLQKVRIQTDAKDRQMAAEFSVKERMGTGI